MYVTIGSPKGRKLLTSRCTRFKETVFAGLGEIYWSFYTCLMGEVRWWWAAITSMLWISHKRRAKSGTVQLSGSEFYWHYVMWCLHLSSDQTWSHFLFPRWHKRTDEIKRGMLIANLVMDSVWVCFCGFAHSAPNSARRNFHSEKYNKLLRQQWSRKKSFLCW